MRAIIVAIDFDGTICTHPPDGDLNTVGVPVPHALDVLKELSDHPDVKLMLWTMRSDRGPNKKYLSVAVKYLTDNGIKLWGVNENPDQDWSSSHKQYATVYVDDAALGCPLICHDFSNPTQKYWTHVVDWVKVRAAFVEMGVLKPV